MSKSLPTSITIEEAVARMINLGDIRPGFTPLDMTQFLLLAAEDDLDDAKRDKLPPDQIELFETRVQASKARDLLAANLFRHLTWEIDKPPENSLLVISPDSVNVRKLDVESVAQWARHHYNIGRFDYEELKFDTDFESSKKSIKEQLDEIRKDGLSKGMAISLFQTFAYLFDAYIEKSKCTFGLDNKPNVSLAAERLCQRAMTSKKPRKNLSKQAIQDRIELAIELKDHVFGQQNSE